MPLEEIRVASLRTRRIHLRLLSVFGLAALAVAAIGVYGISAVSARARQRKIAIRAVFGASRREIVSLVLREELQPAILALSTVLGGPRGGSDARRLALSHEPNRPAVHLFVGIVLLAVTGGASYLPARRPGATDPGRELRA